MKIGIIGVGNIGGTLARKLHAAGHEVRVANKGGIAGVQKFAEENDVRPADIPGVIDNVHVIILSIPTPAIQQLPGDLFAQLAEDVIVIDTSNYYPGMRDSHIPDIDDGLTESVWVARQIGRPVIKAFNNVLANTLQQLGSPEGTAGRLAIAVAGDVPSHKEVAMSLVNQVGFDAVDAGALADSWRQQPSTPAYCCDLDAVAMRKALADAIPGVASAKRDRLPELFSTLGANPTHEQVIAMNRKVNAV
ncbi:NAD(P)-binding domain-containing protein [Paraburkholderia sp. CNPSo 3272]|uniref:NADPH-dependent F420 reductase n=1 Tax=Paraburkholderia sp. CNPSo 3272 TaxID=2940931 RepID=UPI0020B89BF8|nr:NAD(P)-binding domain-containing protein [Paraburkholderia sp. CNPSo 3272]